VGFCLCFHLDNTRLVRVLRKIKKTWQSNTATDGNKPPSPYRDYIEEAIKLSQWKPPRVIVYQREQLRWEPIKRLEGERHWQKLASSARARGITADCVPVASTDGVYIIYTSGTTRLPKGVLREAGGHAVGLHLSISYLMNIHGPGDVVSTDAVPKSVDPEEAV